ncbi:hypothetical protein BJ170DRAFT_589267 [Xylariales sp. AK1849]|nr:hypothetical protein BJ170DRAFT_589267 [Xylariales sp. AK1849]
MPASSISSSSSRSSASSSCSQLPAYAQNLTSSVDLSRTPDSTVSALTDEFSNPVLSEWTADERTVDLGPWEVVGYEHRRVLWPCSYELERLAFRNSHRDLSPYTSCTISASLRSLSMGTTRYISRAASTQGDLRRKDLVDCFDVDVVWTDRQGRTDAFGNVRGIGTVQRLKLWSDRHDTSHSLSVFANRSDRWYREFQVESFEVEVRGRDGRRRTPPLNTQGRRRTASESGRCIYLSAFRPRRGSSSSTSSGTAGDIRYLGIQFSRNEGDDTADQL